jgi:CheY-like chemotaxis protein
VYFGREADIVSVPFSHSHSFNAAVKGHASVSASGAVQVDTSTSCLRVLVVEDNPHVIEMYSYVLKKLSAGALEGRVPIEVHLAPDGHSALAQLWQKPFHLVITDLYMPVMDGFALVERIRHDERLKDIPVLVISAGDQDAGDRALGLGVNTYLRKPVKFAQVLETVKHLLQIE